MSLQKSCCRRRALVQGGQDAFAVSSRGGGEAARQDSWAWGVGPGERFFPRRARGARAHRREFLGALLGEASVFDTV
jgi:hypothetical protein